jgi:hypothetical protein
MAIPRPLAMIACLPALLAGAAETATPAAETAYVADRYTTAEAMPLSVYGKPVGYSVTADIDLPPTFDPATAAKAFLRLDVDDIDAAAEARIQFNDSALSDLPPSLFGEGKGHSGWLTVPPAALRSGTNRVTFTFTDNLNQSTLGYLITDMGLLVLRQGEPVPVASVKEPHERLNVPGVGTVLAMNRGTAPVRIRLVRGDEVGWKEHAVKVGNGRRGWSSKPAAFRYLHIAAGNYVFPFGIQQMDNGEVMVLAAWHDGTSEHPVVAFSRDEGDTWTDWQAIPGAAGRPMMLAYLGQGRLTFLGDQRYFSTDYGRTWPERVPTQLPANGRFWGVEGNPLLEFDAAGKPVRMAEIGFNYPDGAWPDKPCDAFLRWSNDEGRTWVDESQPQAWRTNITYEGKVYERSVCEGSLVRARNGWLVAALRTDLLPKYLGKGLDDNLCGTAVSISKDNGKTWTPHKPLFEAGRHHAHLLRLPNGNLLMTLIVRTDVRDGRLASYRRGCEAIVSRDNGVTWDLDRKYVLDEYEFFDGKLWQNGECGHLYSALLQDGRILTVYGSYRTNGAALIRWKP